MIGAVVRNGWTSGERRGRKEMDGGVGEGAIFYARYIGIAIYLFFPPSFLNFLSIFAFFFFLLCFLFCI